MALAAASLCVAAPAHAWRSDEFCAEFDTLIANAPDRFRLLRSTHATYAIDGERRYISLRYLPETKICTITADSDAVLECVYHTGILPVAEDVYKQLIRQVGDCLTPRNRSLVRPDDEDTDTATFTTENLTEVKIDKSHVFGEEVLVRFKPLLEE